MLRSLAPSHLAMLVLLSACAPKRWVNPSVTDPVQVERDRYDCMKENTIVEDHMTVDRAGARAGQRLEVDPVLFEACMRARGYTAVRERQREPGDPGWLRRPSSSEGLVLEVGGSAGTVFSLYQRGTADLAPLLEDPEAEAAIRTSEHLDTTGSTQARAGVVLRPSPNLDLGVWAGLRPTGSEAWITCDAEGLSQDHDLESACIDQYESSTSPALSAGLRLRAPAAPRLTLGAELGAQTVGPAPTGEERVTMYGEDQEDGQEFALNAPGSDRYLVPFLRLGAGLDLIHPDPLGLALDCGAELALRGGVLAGEAEGDGLTGAGTCGLTLRLAPKKEG